MLQVVGDISRILPSLAYVEGATLSLDIPRDSVYKHIILTLSGSVIVTYSNTPVADDAATFSRIVNTIEIVENGSFTIKSVTPYHAHIQQLLATNDFGVRRCSVGAAASSYPTVDAKFTFPTSTQYSSVRESILVSFENVLAGQGRMETLWDTRGLSSAELKLNCTSFSNLLGYGNTDTPVFSANLFSFTFETIETQSIPLQAYFAYWKQTTKSASFSAQVSDNLIDINRGNYLQGILLEARDGAPGSATTATGRVLSNTLLTNLKLIFNGVQYLQNTTFQTLQDKNRSRYGLNAPYVTNKSLMDGMAYMDLLTPKAGEKFGSLSTVQPAMAPDVDQVQLSVSTSSAATYTATASIKIQTLEIVPAQTQKK
jgi:hypothetical protein